MNREFEHDGFWWLPETPENEVPGKMRFVPSEGVRLELQGALDAPGGNKGFRPPTFINPDIILGYTVAGKDVTLRKCIQTGRIAHLGGVETTSFIANAAFLGAHFQSPDAIKFQSVYVRYSHLDHWVDSRAFEIELPDNKMLIVRHKQSSPIEIAAQDYKISFVCWGPSFSWDPVTHVNVSQEATMVVSSITERPLDEYLDLIRRIQDFLSLAMTKPTFPTMVQGISDVSKQTLGDRENHLPIDVYYALPWLPPEIKTLHSFEMLFTLPTVQKMLETYLGNWINKTDLLKPVYDLYFSTLYSPQTFIEFKFLSLAQAVETYHRRVYGGKYQTDEEYLRDLYKRLVNAVPSDLDQGFRRSLIEGKLRYANEYSLRKRLRELTSRYSSMGIPFGFLQSKAECTSFINKVCDTRNYLTHYTPDLEPNAARSEELFHLIDKMRALLEVAFLEELGFTTDAIQELITHNRRYVTVLA